ncbi:MAG TPA: sulfite exporter TauE/SafE family protein [Solirubrobacterales bacterium]|nr:sulfite exporter TauE/SafE family protein [Solirubrobacterales bacterium]
MLGDAILGAAVAFCLAALTTPVGVSGAVFLVPFQVSVVETPSPAVTPTNLLFNLIAIPGALVRFHREGRLLGPLSRLLVLGTLPGVVAGAVIRVALLNEGDAFLVVVAAVLIPLGTWLLLAQPPVPAGAPDLRRRRQIVLLSLAVGTVGGIYGIGGGSILAPILVGFGFAVSEVAPAALLATFLTSFAGVLTYALLSLGASGDVAPDWTLGLGMGIGGLAGANLGARLQPRLPEALLRRGLGLLALALGAHYAVQALG